MDSAQQNAESSEQKQAHDDPPLSDRRWTVGGLIGLTVLVAALYLPALAHPFMFDDLFVIRQSEGGNLLTDVQSLIRYSTRPLTDITFAINHAAHGPNPRGYRAVNIIIHLCAGLVLWQVLRKTFRRWPDLLPDAPWIEPVALSIAALWLAHPVQTQAVTYIMQRYESLASLFILLTLYMAIKTAEADTRAARIFSGGMCVLLCVLGVLSKQIAAVAPLLVLLYDRTFLGGSFGNALRQRWGLYISLIGVWVLVWYLGVSDLVVTDVTTAEGLAPGDVKRMSAGLGSPNVTPMQYLLCQATAITHYLKISVWPNVLLLDYGIRVQEALSNVFWRLVLVVSLAVLAVWLNRKRPAVSFILLSFFIILGPSSSIIPVIDLVVDHRMYLALSCVLILLIVGGSWLLRRHAKIAVAFAVVILICISIRTTGRQKDYASLLRTWEQCAIHQPSNRRAWLNYAVALYREDRQEESRDALLKVLRYAPFNSNANRNLGEYYLNANDHNKAFEYLRRARLRVTNTTHLTYLMGETRFRQQRIDEAITLFNDVLKESPQHTRSTERLARLMLHQGDLPQAKRLFIQTLSIDPCNSEAPEGLAIMAGMMAKQGHRAEAIELLEETIQKVSAACPENRKINRMRQRLQQIKAQSAKSKPVTQ